MGSFSFDFSRLNPMFDAVSTYMPAILNAKAREAQNEPQRTQSAYDVWLRSKIQDINQRSTDTERRYKAEDAAQALQQHLLQRGERQQDEAAAEAANDKTLTLRSMLGANQNMATKYGGGPIDPEATMRDFYLYGPYSKGGRGGGGSAPAGDTRVQDTAISSTSMQNSPRDISAGAPRYQGAGGVVCPPGYTQNAGGGCTYAGGK